MLITSCRESKIESGSMAPTIKEGQAVTVNYTAYVTEQPVRWDVVAYANDKTNGRTWCHRVVGLPGETIDIRNSQVVINGQPLPYPAKIATIRYIPMIENSPTAIQLPYTIPKNKFFVLGDNTSDAADSRYIGPIDQDDIKGRIEGK
jgi:signal peptidase I